MAKNNKNKKRPRDFNEMAASILEDAVNPQPEEPTDKNPAAVALGRLSGLKGGKARAKKLTSEQRSDIARKAAKKRWANK